MKGAHMGTLHFEQQRVPFASLLPKRWHSRLLALGSPHRGGTWRDEGINGLLKKVALSAHRATWAPRLLLEFKCAFGLTARATAAAKRRKR
eukprot:465407-Alexandrium_andersonii.AAC.1